MPHLPAAHEYRTSLTWAGSTAGGIRDYERAHDVRAEPAQAGLRLSADPTFRGDAGLLNPEQLLVAAASSCQLLSFLAVAARAGVDVRDYSDHACGVMPTDDPPMRVTRIELTPRITVAPGTDHDEVRRLVERGHEECFIARSVRSEIHIEATVLDA